MALTADVRGYSSVQSWIEGLREQWGEEPSDLDRRLEVLQRFCQFMSKDPDTLIDDCSRVVESGKRIKIKVRRQYTEKIAEFQSSADGDGRAQARAGNIVRSFFIHNGIFMQAGLQG